MEANASALANHRAVRRDREGILKQGMDFPLLPAGRWNRATTDGMITSGDSHQR